MDPGAFKGFELAGWQRVAAEYHDAFAPLTTQAIESLLDAAHVGRGTGVLDVATGPGYMAAVAAARGAEVVAVDFSEPMLALARTAWPELDFRQGDAERLESADRSFDAVVMNFGLLHLSNPDLALREAHRVLRSGGWLAFTVWAPPTEAVVFGIVLEAIERHGDLSVPLPPGPPFFRFSDEGECRAALLSAGFDTVTVKRIPQIWRLESVDRLFTAMLGATVRTGGLLQAQTPAALERIRRAVSDAVARYRSGDTIALPMPAVLAAAMAQ
jgi:SAM-dependent methyltransferase